MSNRIPTKQENPIGPHQRYHVMKIVPNPYFDSSRPIDDGNHTHKLGNTDPGAEYFVLRLDEGGKDREHIKACRIGIHAYANAIEHHLPELAKDLRERYPLI